MLFKTLLVSAALGVSAINLGAPTNGALAPDAVDVKVEDTPTPEKSEALLSVEASMAQLKALTGLDAAAVAEKVSGQVADKTIEAVDAAGIEEKLASAKALYAQLEEAKALLEAVGSVSGLEVVGDAVDKVNEAEAKAAELKGKVEGLLGEPASAALKSIVAAAIRGDEEALDAAVQASMAKLAELAEETVDDYQQKVEKMIADGVMDAAEKHNLDEKAAKAKELYAELSQTHNDLMALIAEADPDTHAFILEQKKALFDKLNGEVDKLLGDGTVSKLKEILVAAKGVDSNNDGVIDESEARRGRRVAAAAGIIELFRCLARINWKACCSCCGKGATDVVEVTDERPEAAPLRVGNVEAPAAAPAVEMTGESKTTEVAAPAAAAPAESDV